MPFRNTSALSTAFLVVFVLAGRLSGAVSLTDTPSSAASPSFPLVSGGAAAPIVLPANAPEVVKTAARDLAEDIAAVTGVKPEILTAAPAGKDLPLVELVLAPKELAGKWEAFRLSARPGVLSIAGSDPRGLAFGIYEVSRRIGVSPWRWWADVPVAKRSELHLSAGEEPVDQPAVKYRGIFINDEDWGLEPWARLTFEPEVGDIGPKTYSKIFELLLRLRANTLWPAMHESTKAFHLVPGNAAAADRYAMIMGSSHAEPMLRNNVGEWKEDHKLYNYVTNRDGVLAYWEQRVKERTLGESLFTLGMRGIHDSPIVGPKDQKERIQTLEKIFSDQRELLARYLGNGDPARVGQIFCPYKEVLEDYLAGLKVPEDVTIVYPDDNFGYVRRFATAEERKRPGALGVYYHASYLGAPLSWLWVDSMPPALIWSEMIRAYEQGARNLWIINAGDIKNTERSVEFFLDLAWHADRTNPEAGARFLRETAARDFGPAHAGRIVEILRRHQALAFARKPEHLQWHLPMTPYQPTTLTEREIIERLDAYAALDRDVTALAPGLPAEAQDAFFELVGYPVQSAAAANERYFRAELARRERARGDAGAGNTFTASEHALQRMEDLAIRYNEHVAGGKWRHIVAINGMSPRMWPRYQPTPAIPPLSSDAQKAVAAPAPAPSPSAMVAPSDARPGDFVERDRVVSIHAGHFADRKDGSDGAGWRLIPGLGRTGCAVTVLPSTAVIAPESAPSLSYRFHAATGGAAKLRVRLLPTHPLVTGQGLRLAVAIDDGAPIPLTVTKGFDTKDPEWGERVLSNATEAAADLPQPLAPGWHTLRLVAVDAGVVVDRIVLDFGGLQPSYDGPAETRLP